MPNWKKIIISGSNASLRTVTASVFLATPGATSVGFQGTSSWAQNALTASHVNVLATSSNATFYITMVDSENVTNPQPELLYTAQAASLGFVPITANPANSSITANSFIGTASWASNAVSSSLINTIRSSTNAVHYLTFVDSANTPAAAEQLYTSTTNGLMCNPSNSSITASGGFFGTASWAQNAVSASWAPGGTPITFYNGNANASYSNLTTLYVSGSGVTISNPSAGIVSMSIAGVPAGSGTTISNNVNNYIVTATGTSPELNGEANLSFNGSTLNVTGSLRVSGGITGSLLGTAASASVANSVYFTASNANINYGIAFGPQTAGDVGNATMHTKTGFSINPSEYSNTGLLDAKNLRTDDRLIIKKALLMSRGLGTLQASNYVIGNADLFVLVDTQFAVDIDLRAAENADNDGRVIVVKDGAGNASVNPITFTTGANIEAGTGYSPDDNWESIVLVWDNNLNTWWVIAKFIP